MVVCTACKCHVHRADAACAHCGADLTLPGAARKPERRRVEIRRVFYATALAGLGVTGCGGRVPNEDIQGTCASLNATTQGAPSFSCNSATGTLACGCGTGGMCDNGKCVSCGCAQDETCNAGVCEPSPPSYWFEGQLWSSHSCYGAPPVLA